MPMLADPSIGSAAMHERPVALRASSTASRGRLRNRPWLPAAARVTPS